MVTNEILITPSEGATSADTGTLDVFFSPETVAVFGATETPSSAGRTLMANLIHSPFGGTLFPIHPHRAGVLGIKAYPSLAAVDGPVELAIVATPAATVPGIIAECAAAGVQGAIILSAGFGESGAAGADLDRRIRACKGSMRILGPNSIGVACPRTGVNATFAPAMVPAGNVGFLSQSGAILPGLLSKERLGRVGCSAFVSVGSMLDIGWDEWIRYLAEDAQTECLGIYLETLPDARAFFSAVRQAATQKPVILVRGGETGRRDRRRGMAEDAFEEACRCCGVLRVGKISELFRMAEILTRQPPPQGPGVTILTNTRSLGLLAADAVGPDGPQLAALTPWTLQQLDEILPHRRHHNPIDIGDDAGLDRFQQASAIALDDASTDALLVILTPHATIDPVRAAEHLAGLAGRKPILACWMWEAGDPTSLRILQEAGISVCRSPETAMRTLAYLGRHHQNLLSLAESPAELAQDLEITTRTDEARAVIRAARLAGRTVLTEIECRRLLAAYGLPTLESALAGSAGEAVEIAERLGVPVVLGLETDSGRSQEKIELKALSLADVQRAFDVLQRMAREYFLAGPSPRIKVQALVEKTGLEITLASVAHSELGQVIELGTAESRENDPHNRVIILPPFTARKLQQWLERACFFRTLQESVDVDVLLRFLRGFGQLVVEQRWIKEMTINPVLLLGQRAVALKTQILLHDPQMREEELPELVLGPWTLPARPIYHSPLTMRSTPCSTPSR